MGEVLQAEFGLGLSRRAEAKLRGCSRTTVDHERTDVDLPYTYVRGTDGRICRARQLTPEMRRVRDHRIKLLLQCGVTVTEIAATVHCGRGTVSRVAAKTAKRRRAHVLSRRAWKGRGVTDETG